MSAHSKVAVEPIRLVFELTRSDHPRLYDDLIQFPKGTKRINRLRVLAYDGLLVQGGIMIPTGHPHVSVEVRDGVGAPGGDITNDLFGPSLKD